LTSNFLEGRSNERTQRLEDALASAVNHKQIAGVVGLDSHVCRLALKAVVSHDQTFGWNCCAPSLLIAQVMNGTGTPGSSSHRPPG
jgi:hypothetical protein